MVFVVSASLPSFKARQRVSSRLFSPPNLFLKFIFICVPLGYENRNVNQNVNQTMKKLTTLRAHAQNYKGVVCDLWGVIHNGRQAYVGAVETLRGLKREGKFVILLSNSPRPSEVVRGQLSGLGVTHKCYDAIVTSGDLAREFLMVKAPGASIFHLGPIRDRPTLEGIANPERSEITMADYIFCTGFFEDRDMIPELYENLLAPQVQKGTPLICVNPDREVVIGDRRVLCAGALAGYYESLGGVVHWLGKPKKVAYDKCFDVIREITGSPLSHKDLLAIGDNLETDILGAANEGLATVLITGGLHGHEQVEGGDLEALMDKLGVRPGAIMKRLEWE